VQSRQISGAPRHRSVARATTAIMLERLSWAVVNDGSVRRAASLSWKFVLDQTWCSHLCARSARRVRLPLVHMTRTDPARGVASECSGAYQQLEQAYLGSTQQARCIALDVDTPVTAAFLAGDPATDLRPFLRFWDQLSYPMWTAFADAVRTGSGHAPGPAQAAQRDVAMLQPTEPGASCRDPSPGPAGTHSDLRAAAATVPTSEVGRAQAPRRGPGSIEALRRRGSTAHRARTATPAALQCDELPALNAKKAVSPRRPEGRRGPGFMR